MRSALLIIVFVHLKSICIALTDDDDDDPIQLHIHALRTQLNILFCLNYFHIFNRGSWKSLFFRNLWSIREKSIYYKR